MNMYLNRVVFYKKLAIAPDRSFLSLKQRGGVTKQQISWWDLDHLRRLMGDSPGEEDRDYKTEVLAIWRFGEEKKRKQIAFKRGNWFPFLKKSCVLNLWPNPKECWNMARNLKCSKACEHPLFHRYLYFLCYCFRQRVWTPWKNLETLWALTCPLMHKVGALDKLMPKELRGLRKQHCSYSPRTALLERSY